MHNPIHSLRRHFSSFRDVKPFFIAFCLVLLSLGLLSTQKHSSNAISQRQRQFPPPKNISGSYIGFWHSLTLKDHIRPSFSSEGTFRLFVSSFTLPDVPSLEFLQGDVLLRDEDTGSDKDLRFAVDGVYDPSKSKVLLFANTEDWLMSPEIIGALGTTNQTGITNRIAQEYPREMTEDTSIQYSPCTVTARFNVSEKGSPVVPLFEGHSPTFSILNDPNEVLHVFMTGEISSSNCNFNVSTLSSSIAFESYIQKARIYAIITSMISGVQILSLVRQTEYSTPQARAGRLSQMSFMLQALLDSYLSLFHLTSALVMEPLFPTFLISALLQFMTFSLFEMRLLLLAWKSRRQDIVQEGWEAVRRELGNLYLKFYGALFFGLFAVYVMQVHVIYLITILYSFWIPQIIHNAVTASRKSLQTSFLCVMSISRMFLPLYFFGCPSNFLNMPTNYAFCYLIVFYLLLQSSIVYMQDTYGSRFFIPVRFLPAKYNYWRPSEISPEDSCTICLLDIFEHEEHQLPSNAMVCPCGHVFHEECLLRWMEQKMECPTCRGPLPSL